MINIDVRGHYDVPGDIIPLYNSSIEYNYFFLIFLISMQLHKDANQSYREKENSANKINNRREIFQGTLFIQAAPK